MDIENLSTDKNEIEQTAEILQAQDIAQLVSLLTEKNDQIRYPAFLLLQKRSQKHNDIYAFWQVFVQKLHDANSYQRSIGIMLLAENIRWDKQQQFAQVFSDFVSHFQDEKFITSRQTIQTIPIWAKYARELLPTTMQELINIDIGSFKETQKRLILLDIINALLAIRQLMPNEQIDCYISQALTGGILDNKSIKQLEKLL